MNDQKLNMKQTEQLLREHGFWLSASDIADGIETGVYPFGRLVRVSEDGRRTFEVFRGDVIEWVMKKARVPSTEATGDTPEVAEELRRVANTLVEISKTMEKLMAVAILNSKA